MVSARGGRSGEGKGTGLRMWSSTGRRRGWRTTTRLLSATLMSRCSLGLSGTSSTGTSCGTRCPFLDCLARLQPSFFCTSGLWSSAAETRIHAWTMNSRNSLLNNRVFQWPPATVCWNVLQQSIFNPWGFEWFFWSKSTESKSKSLDLFYMLSCTVQFFPFHFADGLYEYGPGQQYFILVA